MKQILVAAVVLAATGGALAQDSPVRMLIQQSPRPLQDDQVRVNVSMNLIVPGAPGLSDQALQAQEQARRKAYELAAHECAVLRDTIANECRLESMNVNANRFQGSYSNSRPENFSVGITASFRITLK